MTAPTLAPRLTGRHVLFILMGFFGVMIAVNALFLYFALTTFNGLDRPQAYETGLRYNETLAAEQAQDALGWAHTASVAADGRVRLSFRDAAGAPVTRLKLAGTVGRPADARFDRALTFDEAEPGLYVSREPLAAPGTWIAKIGASAARRGEPALTYTLKERLWLSPQ